MDLTQLLAPIKLTSSFLMQLLTCLPDWTFLHSGGVIWKRLFETLIELAKNFLVGERLSRMIYDNYGKNNSIWMRKSKIWSEIFFSNNQSVIRTGDYIHMGIQIFYSGSGKIAQQLVETINGDGGGDPNFLNGTEILQFKKFTSKIFANKIFKKIDDKQTYGFLHYNPHYDLQEDHGTTHLTVIDWMGSTISLTSTINMIFGSELMDQRTGIILNNELDDFSIPGRWNDFNLSPSPLNYPEKGSISPVTFDRPDKETWCSLVGSGGSRILSFIISTILKLDWGINLLDSIDDFDCTINCCPMRLSLLYN
ncbi:nucleophile aminohydrolase [Phakopsora pachyrhizi]|uniref:Nucleophile aminohydrolase n=1 Tax=Phakopsora pachyrhizi TaxID=170000 RepID=A0AAV0BA90_PHAPC|nr:nucleophile aminohydrolase [Phakopsora pachyrhizi]